MTSLRVDVWSDVACPWCWVGKRNLEQALGELGHAVDVRWHAFELDPSAPVKPPTEIDYVGRLATKYGTSRSEAQEMIDRMVRFGAERGIEFRFDRAQPSNTFDAHRLLAFAAGRGLQSELKERLLRAYLNEGRCIAGGDVLVELAEEVGLDPDEARAVISSDAYAKQVREDESLAAEVGITGVPFFVVGGRFAVAGAQPPEVLAEALSNAAAVSTDSEDEATDADACGPEGCDLPTGRAR